MLLGVRDTFCCHIFLFSTSISDEFLNFDLSNINVMREPCLQNNLNFVPISLKFYGALMR